MAMLRVGKDYVVMQDAAPLAPRFYAIMTDICILLKVNTFHNTATPAFNFGNVLY